MPFAPCSSKWSWRPGVCIQPTNGPWPRGAPILDGRDKGRIPLQALDRNLGGPRHSWPSNGLHHKSTERESEGP